MTDIPHIDKKKYKLLSPIVLAWLLPVTIFIHQLEEYFGEFPAWFSNLLNAELSNNDFLMINGIGLFIFIAIALIYTFSKNNMLLVALGTLVFVNGMTHLIASILTLSYSPGTISGTLLFIPLGIIIYKKILPLLKESEKIIAITLGIISLLAVSIVAINI